LRASVTSTDAPNGPLVDAPGETSNGINQALWQGLRGLPGGSSLSKLLGRRPAT